MKKNAYLKAGLILSGIMLGLLIVLGIEAIQTKCSIREKVSQWNVVGRSILYSTSVLIILIFGIYGIGYDNSTFIYMNF